MPRSLSRFSLLICLLFIASSLAGAASRDRGLPHRYLPGSLDGNPAMLDNTFDGRTWAAWAYRNGIEYDLAVSIRGEDGFWTEPDFFGRGDGVHQEEPSLVVDREGTVYLAYSERPTGRIMLTWFQRGAAGWSMPVELSAPDVRAVSPALRVVGDRLVVAFRSGRALTILDFPVVGELMGTAIFNDGPDPVESREPIADADQAEEDPNEDDPEYSPFEATSGTGGGGPAPSTEN